MFKGVKKEVSPIRLPQFVSAEESRRQMWLLLHAIRQFVQSAALLESERLEMCVCTATGLDRRKYCQM